MEKNKKKSVKKKTDKETKSKKEEIVVEKKDISEKEDDKEVKKEKSVKEKLTKEKKEKKDKKDKKEKKKRKGFFKSIFDFFKGVKEEMSRVVWPNKRDMIKYSIATIIFILVFAIYFYGIEVLMAWLKSIIVII